jgi:serine/threonine protein kinase
VALALGTRLGPYEILSAIGAGGMGEVYRARDTKLNRDVALKILPAAFALDGDRIARFGREAQVLAALRHPNIAAIYGFEDSGATHALVLELVEGPTLADRITKGSDSLSKRRSRSRSRSPKRWRRRTSRASSTAI